MSKIASPATTNEANSSQLHSKNAPLRSSFADYLHPRRNQHSWFVFRLALGIFGAALVLLPLALPQSWIASIFGLAFFMTSILLPPLLTSHKQEEKPAAFHPHAEVPPAHHAQSVIHGAEYCTGFGAVPVELIVSREQILAMKPNLQPAVVVPAAEISSVFLQRSENSWLLFLLWSGKETAFAFHGPLAQRHARKAEAAIHSVIQPTPFEKPKVRAAGA